MIKRLLMLLLALLVVLVIVADRVGAAVAGHVLADKVQSDEHLPSRPGVSVGGIPFLTQAFGGKYQDVTVTSRHLMVDSVPVTKLTAHLHGVHIPFGKAVHGDVHTVPVDRTDGTVFISYADVDRYLAPRHLQVSNGGNGSAKVTASITVAGHRFSAGGQGHVSVANNVVHLTVTGIVASAGGQVGRIPSHLSVPIPLVGLPFQISLASVTATSTGIQATGTVRHLVLGSH